MQPEEFFASLKTLSNDTKISLLSALAAVTSAFYAWKTYRETKRSIDLAKIDFDERHGDIKPYLIDVILWKNKKQENLIAIACSFHNSASIANSIFEFELALHFYSEDESSRKAILTPTATNISLPWNLKPLQFPLNLESRSTISDG